MDKKELREHYKRLRMQITVSERSRLNSGIYENFTGSEIYKNTMSFLFYVSTEFETDTIRLIKRALSDNKKIAVPRAIISQKRLDFYQVKDLSELKPGSMGILEPHIEENKIDADEFEACVIPAFCFDKRGFRLGYGAGFYDRFLADYKGLKIGLVYDMFITDSLPVKDYDVGVDILITDKEVKLFEKI